MTQSNIIRIGTRESALAICQAREVQSKLHQLSIPSEIIQVISDGDVDLETPLYEMGIQGIFTRTLDNALLQKKVDIAVHSAKDIPTRLASGLCLCAVLERGSAWDTLVQLHGSPAIDLTNTCTIATSSLRRKTQWLYRYPSHRIESLRGNIQTRLDKLNKGNWQGAIFAQSALDRLKVNSNPVTILEWMLPAPAQGAIAMVCRIDDRLSREACNQINHNETEICIKVEREFLAALHGGCAVPIAAFAKIHNGSLSFKGNILSLNGKQKCEVEMQFEPDQTKDAGQVAAAEIIKRGGESILKTFRRL